jgi:hypothetical protein
VFGLLQYFLGLPRVVWGGTGRVGGSHEVGRVRGGRGGLAPPAEGGWSEYTLTMAELQNFEAALPRMNIDKFQAACFFACVLH